MMRGVIYKITNIKNNKIYIGSTNNLKKRWEDHKSTLKRGKHANIRLQRAFNKYGEDNFTYSIIENCNVKEVLIREQYYLDTLLDAQLYILKKSNNFLKKGYNIKPFAESNLGFRHNKETINRILIKRNIAVLVINLEGLIIGEYLSTIIASKEMNISINSIRTSIKNGKCINNKNIAFIYKKNYFPEFKPVPFRKPKIIKPSIKSFWNEVYVYSIYGEFIESINNQFFCSQKYKINPSNMSRRLRYFSNRLSKDYIFTRIKDLKEILELKEIHNKVKNIKSINNTYLIKDRFNNTLSYVDNLEELQIILNCSKNSIYSTMSEKRRYIKNYKIIKNK